MRRYSCDIFVTVTDAGDTNDDDDVGCGAGVNGATRETMDGRKSDDVHGG